MKREQTLSKLFQSACQGWLRDVLLLLIGSLLSAVAVNVFYVPVRLTMGGISGVVSIIYQLTGRGEFLPLGFLSRGTFLRAGKSFVARRTNRNTGRKMRPVVVFRVSNMNPSTHLENEVVAGRKRL